MQPRPSFKEIVPELRELLAAQLPAFLTKQRWFGGKARRIQSAEIVDIIPLRGESRDALVLIVTVSYIDGANDLYVVPLYRTEAAAAGSENNQPAFEVSTRHGSHLQFSDAMKDEKALSLLLNATLEKRVFTGEQGELRGFQTTAFPNLYASSPGALQPKLLTGEQSNSSVIYGERLILKFFRRIEEGVNPELEIGTFLTEKAHYPHIAPLAGWLEYRTHDGKAMTQAILQTFVPNEGDAWRYTLKSLAGFYEAVAKRGTIGSSLPANFSPQAFDPPQCARESVDSYLGMAGLLARRTAELHLALASESSGPAFVPEPFTQEFQRTLENSLAELTSKTFTLLRQKISHLPGELCEKANELLARQGEIEHIFHSILSAPIEALRTRVHGDYHLGQVLYTGSEFVIIDFEGEPARPLAARRVKQSPLQDVAGMLRSFHYAAFAPLSGAAGQKATSIGNVAQANVWAERWYSWVSGRFLREYFDTSGDASYLPQNQTNKKNLLQLYLLEKSVYELGYELNNRPTWVRIPLEGISQVLAT